VVKGPAQDVVWAELRAKVEVEWEDHLLQVRAELVCAQAAEQRPPILLDSRVIKQAVQSVVLK